MSDLQEKLLLLKVKDQSHSAGLAFLLFLKFCFRASRETPNQFSQPFMVRGLKMPEERAPGCQKVRQGIEEEEGGVCIEASKGQSVLSI